MNRATFGTSLCAALALAVACRKEPPKSFVESAKFGIFYGGQIEERREIPFELDPTKQTQGFRVEFASPLAANETVTWQFRKPELPPVRARRTKRAANEPPPATEAPADERATIPRGEKRFERAMTFEPGDPLGKWNVRVVIRGRAVIDRAFEVYDAKSRDHLAHRDAGL